MKLSIFTPTHKADYLPDVYASIKNQEFDEWIILLNGGATYTNEDPRVKIFRDDTGSELVGYLKWRCCQHATGDILLELDHDDLLMPHCIAEVRKAFEDPDIGFVYSNTIQTTQDWKPTNRFGDGFGWIYRPVVVREHKLDEYVAFPPHPNAVSRIWFAPNHVRAFRKDAYEAAGGYNKQMRVLDDLDLMCRLYLQTKFYHIDKPLYIYRVHGENAWLKHNAEIQNNVHRIYMEYIDRLAARWANVCGFRKVELGGRMNAVEGFETVDVKGKADLISDLNERWPFPDNSVGVVRSIDVFEHLRDSVHTMRELWRVLVPGGYAMIKVPSTDGRGAFQDPTHVSFWNENSFLYYSDRSWAQYIDTPVRFQAMHCSTTEKNAQGVCWVLAHLIKLDNQRVPGQVMI